MDVKQYIDSGILERYVLGDVSEQEQQEVRCLSKIYPDIKAHLNDYEQVMEKMAMQSAVQAPGAIKASILERIKTTEQLEANAEKSQSEETRVVSMKPRARQMLLVASFTALFISIGLIWSKTNTINQQQVAIEQSEQERNRLLEEEKTLKGYLDFIAQEETQRITLKGTENYPNETARIYWNQQSNEVLLEQVALTELDKNQQYQLWAIIDGKPTDLGVFDTRPQKLSFQNKAAEPMAFAITIEPTGGSVNPTLEKMVVLGQLEV